jgi:S1-C subfamily serine protease
MRVTTALIGLVSFVAPGLLGLHPAAAEKLSAVVRAQPAVFQIEAVGDITVTHPARIGIRYPLLQAEYAANRTAGTLAGLTEAQFYWARVVDDAGRYLEPSNDIKTDTFSLVPYATGSAFAVSREGILLTNAHVIDDVDEVLTDGSTALLLLRDGLDDLVKQLADRFGWRPPDAARKIIEIKLVQWLAGTSHGHARFREARIVLGWRDAPWGPDGSVSFYDFHMRSFPQDHRVTASTRVIAKGAPAVPTGGAQPGKDVAVLQMKEFVRMGYSGREEPFDPKDRLICLPLGKADKDLVLPGTPIFSMGFPGVAFDAALMANEASSAVTSHEGIISGKKPLLGGLELFEMSAIIDSGASGGPVIESSGEVIAINVANAKTFSFAVPIEYAQEMLKKAGIIPDPGPLIAEWNAGLAHYEAGRFADAERIFDQVARQQTTSRRDPIGGHFGIGLGHYVGLMAKRAHFYATQREGRR